MPIVQQFANFSIFKYASGLQNIFFSEIVKKKNRDNIAESGKVPRMLVICVVKIKY
jgi:hypothetical protein